MDERNRAREEVEKAVDGAAMSAIGSAAGLAKLCDILVAKNVISADDKVAIGEEVVAKISHSSLPLFVQGRVRRAAGRAFGLPDQAAQS